MSGALIENGHSCVMEEVLILWLNVARLAAKFESIYGWFVKFVACLKFVFVDPYQIHMLVRTLVIACDMIELEDSLKKYMHK